MDGEDVSRQTWLHDLSDPFLREFKIRLVGIHFEGSKIDRSSEHCVTGGLGLYHIVTGNFTVCKAPYEPPGEMTSAQIWAVEATATVSQTCLRLR